jgi:hypothetical protein
MGSIQGHTRWCQPPRPDQLDKSDEMVVLGPSREYTNVSKLWDLHVELSLMKIAASMPLHSILTSQVSEAELASSCTTNSLEMLAKEGL